MTGEAENTRNEVNDPHATIEQLVIRTADELLRSLSSQDGFKWIEQIQFKDDSGLLVDSDPRALSSLLRNRLGDLAQVILVDHKRIEVRTKLITAVEAAQLTLDGEIDNYRASWVTNHPSLKADMSAENLYFKKCDLGDQSRTEDTTIKLEKETVSDLRNRCLAQLTMYHFIQTINIPHPANVEVFSTTEKARSIKRDIDKSRKNILTFLKQLVPSDNTDRPYPISQPVS